MSYVQNDGTPYFKIQIQSQELATVLNVPNIAITYMAVAYFTGGSNAPTGATINVKDFSNNVLGTVPLAAPATDPTMATSTMNITTSSNRPLKVTLDGSNIDSNAFVNIRSLMIGFK
jgi:hypothetical protein